MSLQPTSAILSPNTQFERALYGRQNTTVPSFSFIKQGKVPIVRTQGECGSCYAHSVTFAVSSAALSAGVTNDPREVDYSPQAIVDCCPDRAVCNGCHGGYIDSGADYVQKFGGAILEKDYPYTGQEGKCHAKKSQIAMKVKSFEWVMEPCWGQECYDRDSQFFLSKVYQRNQMPGVCVSTETWFDYQSGILDTRGCSPNDLNHCLGGILEYVRKEDAPGGVSWITLQSQDGTDWGEGGRIRLKYDPNDEDFNNPCGVFTQSMFANIQV